MELELTSDQQFFQETTHKFLAARCPLAEVRALRHHDAGFDRDYWRQGAELGWTSLLVSEDDGGGSISGDGLVDLTLVGHEFGQHVSPGPLVAANVVAAALSRAGRDEQKATVLAGILAGDTVATWCLNEPPPHDRLGAIGLEATASGEGFVLNGVKRPVEAAAQADQLLITARTAGGLTQFLVPVTASGVTVTPLQSLDVCRRFAEVRFDRVEVSPGAIVGARDGAADDVERQLQLALVIQLAESVGAMEHAFDLTVDWSFQRYSFGRPLASYQELKHRFADMKTWLEASHAVAAAAARAVQAEAPNAAEMVSVAKAYVGIHGTELLQDCVQMHGGIGVTYDHDLHLFLRRATVNRVTYGTPEEHLERLGGILETTGVVA